MTALGKIIASPRLQRLGREAVWIALGQAAVVLGALVGVRILTELLPPASYGELALALTLATLVNQILMGPLSAAATRFYSIAETQAAIPAYVQALRRLMFGATVIAGALGATVVLGAAWAGSKLWIALALATLVFAVLSGYNSILSGIQNAARQRAIVALHQGSASFGRFLLAAGLVLLWGSTSPVAMLGYALAMVLVLASQYMFFRRVIIGAKSTTHDAASPGRWHAQMLSYAWPFAAFGIFTWAHLVSDRWALELFASTAEVGLFAALYQLGYYPVNIATTIMTQLVWPILFKRAADQTDSAKIAKVHQLTNQMAIGVCAFTLLIFLVATQLHELIFAIFTAPDYGSVSWLLPGMLLSGGFYAAGQVISLRYEIGMKARSLSAIKILTAVLGVTANIIGAKTYGLAGVVAASVIFSLFYVTVFFVLSNRSFRAQSSQ